jgi:hypothetical protein
MHLHRKRKRNELPGYTTAGNITARLIFRAMERDNAQTTAIAKPASPLAPPRPRA